MFLDQTLIKRLSYLTTQLNKTMFSKKQKLTVFFFLLFSGFLIGQKPTYLVKGEIFKTEGNQRIGMSGIMVTFENFVTRTELDGSFEFEIESENSNIKLKIEEATCKIRSHPVILRTNTSVEIDCSAESKIWLQEKENLQKKLDKTIKDNNYSKKRIRILKQEFEGTLNKLQKDFDLQNEKIDLLKEELKLQNEQYEKEIIQRKIDALKHLQKENDFKNLIIALERSLDEKQNIIFENYSSVVTNYIFRLKDYLDVLENISIYILDSKSTGALEFIEKQELYEDAYRSVELNKNDLHASLNKFWSKEESLQASEELFDFILNFVHAPLRKNYKEKIVRPIFEKQNMSSKKAAKKSLAVAYEIKDLMNSKVLKLESKIQTVIKSLQEELPKNIIEN